MRRLLAAIVPVVAVALLAVTLVTAQEGTPEGNAGTYENEFGTPCVALPDASPGASPEATPAASPISSPVASPDAFVLPGCPTDEATPGVAGGEAAQGVQLEAYDIGWRTADQPGPQVTLTAAPGATIQITNVGAAPHNFDLQALGLFVDLPAGGSGEALVPADAVPGEYEFICSVPGHAPAGMVGTLIVE